MNRGSPQQKFSALRRSTSTRTTCAPFLGLELLPLPWPPLLTRPPHPPSSPSLLTLPWGLPSPPSVPRRTLSIDLEVICRLRNLERLSLQGNKLLELPSKIGTLHALKDLNLQSNRLTRLQGSIGALKKLRSLNLKGNQLTQLTPSIGNLSALKKLDLSDNLKLRSLPKDMCNLQPELELVAQRDRGLVTFLGAQCAGGIPHLKKYFAEHPDEGSGSFLSPDAAINRSISASSSGRHTRESADSSVLEQRRRRMTKRPPKEGLSRHYHVSDVGHVVMLYNCCGAAHEVSDGHVAITAIAC